MSHAKLVQPPLRLIELFGYFSPRYTTTHATDKMRIEDNWIKVSAFMRWSGSEVIKPSQRNCHGDLLADSCRFLFSHSRENYSDVRTIS